MLHAYLGPLLAFGIPLGIAVPVFLYFKHTMHGASTKLIVVVDRRTMQLAQTRIAEAIEDGDLNRANYGLVSLMTWLHHERITGPDKYRIAYATLLKQAELTKATISPCLAHSRHTV
jgi:hypothetical protein